MCNLFNQYLLSGVFFLGEMAWVAVRVFFFYYYTFNIVRMCTIDSEFFFITSTSVKPENVAKNTLYKKNNALINYRNWNVTYRTAFHEPIMSYEYIGEMSGQCM